MMERNITSGILLICCCIFCYNCSNNNKVRIVADAAYVIDINKAEEKDVFHLSDIVEKVRPIRLEETDYALIGEIDKIQAFDNNIFVLDAYIAKKLFVYDMNGKYIQQIGAMGQGPDEYMGVLSFCIDTDKKEIYLLDYWKYRLLKYRIEDGKLLDKINLPHDISYSDLVYVENNIYMCITHDNYEENDNLLFKIDLKTKKITEYLSAGEIFNTNKNIQSGWFFYGNSPKYSRYYAATVFSCKEDGVYPYIAVKSDDWVHGEDVYDDNSMTDIIKENYAYVIIDYYESDACIHFNYCKGSKTRHIAYNKQTGVTYHYLSIVNDINYRVDGSNFYNVMSVNSKYVYDMMYSNIALSFLKEEKFSLELERQMELLDLDEEGYVLLEYEFK
jgi:hypothetical protein